LVRIETDRPGFRTAAFLQQVLASVRSKARIGWNGQGLSANRT